MNDGTRVNLADYKTDKTAEYLQNYERELVGLFGQPVKMLELGVQYGGSLLLWSDIFPGGSVTGVDLNPAIVEDTRDGRIRTFQGFQQDTEFLDEVARQMAPEGFDLIVDDASHIGEYTAQSFWHLFRNHLKPGGIYVLEDWRCAYNSSWPDGHDYRGAPQNVGESYTVPQRGNLEAVRRRVRSVARPISRKLDTLPKVKGFVTRLYMKAEGATVRSRFPSHEYGMAGFVKQVIDAASIAEYGANSTVSARPSDIERVSISGSQVFIWKVL